MAQQKKQDRPRLFISYSRTDKTRVDALHEALAADDDVEVFLDTHDIAAAEEWKPRLENLIRSADTILFVVSPASVGSEICQWELELAERLNKRIIPVVVKNVPDADVPPEIGKLNFIFCRKKTEFEPAVKSIDDALKIDIDWIREHTRLTDMAHRWDQTKKLGAQSLRGKELERAEQWLATQPKNAPQPTEPQRQYIYESRKAATKRQRTTVIGSVAAVMVVGVLAGFAFIQRNAAIEGERKASEALRAATEAANTLVFDLAEEFKDSPVPSRIIENILEKARKLQDGLSLNFEGDTELQRSRAVSLNLLADVYSRLGKFNEAKGLYEQAFKLSKSLVDLDPTDFLWQHDLASAYSNIGDLHWHHEEATAAYSAYEESFKISRKLMLLNPEDIISLRNVVTVGTKIADIFRKGGELTDALRYYERSYSTIKILHSLEPSDVQVEREVYLTLSRIGKTQLELGNQIQALADYKNALTYFQLLSEKHPNNMLLQVDVALCFSNTGSVQIQLGRIEAGARNYQKSLQIRRALSKSDSSRVDWQRDMSVSLFKLGKAHADLKDYRSSYSNYQELLEHSKKLALQFPDSKEFPSHIKLASRSAAHQAAGLTLQSLENKEFGNAEKWARQALHLHPKSKSIQVYLGHALLFQDRTAQAEQVYADYLSGLPEVSILSKEYLISTFEVMKQMGLQNAKLDALERKYRR